MKANKAQIEKAMRAPSAETRLFLLYGPDEAGSRALAKILASAMGQGAERVDLSGPELKADPARLVDEAASLSLFGGARYICVEPAGDDAAEAAQALLDASTGGNPVVMVAGTLKAGSRLLKLALSAPSALAFASYVPEGRDADKLVLEMGREEGLGMRPDVARRIADATAGNRGIIAQELAKFAAFTDAAPDRPRQIDHDVLDAVGARSDEGDLSRLVDSVSSGDPPTLQAELARLASEGVDGIPLIRAVLRRLTLLSKLRAEVDHGSSVDSIMASHGKALFWKEKPVVSQQLSRWRSDLLGKAVARLLEAERQVKAPGGLGAAAVNEELFAICRQAARLR
ncbi:MAG: DNA polymerase III subunit delta [Pseudomonadota bacterium]|nr:DNA polymerase III subunit delta [Pseudomonadota bacterium]